MCNTHCSWHSINSSNPNKSPKWCVMWYNVVFYMPTPLSLKCSHLTLMLIIWSTHVDYIKHSRTRLNLTIQNAPSHLAFSSLQRRQHSAVSHCKTHWRGTRKGCDIAILHHQPGKLEHRKGLARRQLIRWYTYVLPLSELTGKGGEPRIWAHQTHSNNYIKGY